MLRMIKNMLNRVFYTQVSRSVEISAPPTDVWSKLIDTQSYPSWNPFLRINGELNVGEQVELFVTPEEGTVNRFTPTVIDLVDREFLRWEGHLLIMNHPSSLILTAQHWFRLEPTVFGTTRVVHGEDFWGLAVPFANNNLQTTYANAFTLMNEALKNIVESEVSTKVAKLDTVFEDEQNPTEGAHHFYRSLATHTDARLAALHGVFAEVSHDREDVETARTITHRNIQKL